MQPPLTLVNQLLLQARDGSESAVEQLLASYRDYLQNLATQRLGCKLGGRVSPSDIVQETLLAAWRDFPAFRGSEAPQFAVWMRTILLRKISAAVATHLKSSKRDVQRELINLVFEGSSVMEVTNGLCGREDTPSKIVAIGEDTQLLKSLLENLPDEYRLVIQWRNSEGIRFNDIAKRLGKTSGATRLIWLRAIRMLREMHEAHEAQS